MLEGRIEAAQATVCWRMSSRADGSLRAGGGSGEQDGGQGSTAANVAHNRASWTAQIGRPCIALRQVHGIGCVRLNAQSAQQQVADASVTTDTTIALEIGVADCLPVLLWSASGSVVGAAHAGWRGLIGNAQGDVLQATLSAMRALCTQPHESVHAWLGPCIGAHRFEVGSDVVEALIANSWGSSGIQTGHKLRHIVHTHREACGQNKYLADLVGLARLRLRALGVMHISGNDGGPQWCTVSNPTRYFSYRREGMLAGRMGALIWIEE